MSSRVIIYKGLLLAPQISDFYLELADPLAKSSLCMVHQRFSTNTFPTWKLAHPYRMICHNGEINTVRGNVNWMNARESVLQSDLFGEDLSKTFPVIRPGGSDTACLDNAVEMLTLAGRELPHVMAMLIPEAWDADTTMPDDKRAFYEYHASLMEPWDGPAAVAFTDGKWLGATLDRNGLRPARYMVTTSNELILASETGVLPIKPEEVQYKGRLQPGRMLLVNLEEHRIVPDEEIKHMLASRQPYGAWLKENLSYRPAIVCTGAAIALLSGAETVIPRWADATYLGWLLRIFGDPQRFLPRYLRATDLARLIFLHGRALPPPSVRAA